MMTGWRTFSLRILKASWGIAIDLQARAVLAEDPPHDLLSVSPRVWLDVSGVQLPDADIKQLVRGLTVMAPAIENKNQDAYVIIEVGRVSYTPTDYQPEGMAAAMIGWVAEEFGLDSPVIDVYFDKNANRYVFSI
jgi:hypothetical protein